MLSEQVKRFCGDKILAVVDRIRRRFARVVERELFGNPPTVREIPENKPKKKDDCQSCQHKKFSRLTILKRVEAKQIYDILSGKSKLTDKILAADKPGISRIKSNIKIRVHSRLSAANFFLSLI